MALVLAIDIRNTRTRIGLALDGRLVSQWAVPTDPDETADGAVACVLGFFDALARGLAPIEKDAPDAIDLPESAPLADGAIIASVIPALTGVWSDAARRLTDARPLTVGPGLKTGLKMNFSDPTAVGADRIAANGDAANKIGTYGVAVLARHHGIPFYVAAPISTIDPAIADGSGIPIEERDPAEVLPQPLPGVEVWNPAFDVTPAALITRIVTERGAFEPDKLVY